MMNIRSFLIVFSLVLLSKSTFAESPTTPEYQDIEKLRMAVIERVKDHYLSLQPNLIYEEDLFIEVGHLDTRLNLSRCDDSLTMKINKPPHSSGRLTVKTSCKTGSRWTIYVPTTIEIFDDVVVAAHDIARGTPLSIDDLTTMRLNTAKLGIGIARDPQTLVGLELTRPTRSGTPIQQSHLQKPDIVAKGDTVVLEAKSSLLSVIVNGTALDPGHLGEQIRVRNNQSQRVVDGLVVGPGKVRVASY